MIYFQNIFSASGKKNSLLFLFFFFLFGFSLQAQLENVIIETYYISDANDASDTTGSVVPVHSTTYRIYIDMEPGCKLRKVYGNNNHEFSISGDSVFYNHTLEGQTFARNFNVARLGESTVALDSWLTLGQTSLSKPTGKTYFGTLKSLDRNGSIIGGSHNDGGSKPAEDGLLINNDAAAGIALTLSDGMDTMAVIPNGYYENGVADQFGNDSTIFGSLKKGSIFSSKQFAMQNSGVMGVNRDSNQVLIAQLTTKGKISFALNVEIEDKNGSVFSYVAKNGADSLAEGIIQKPFLNFPIPCGCTDPDYYEFSDAYGCSDSTACQTKLVAGCTDSMACNFDSKANISISSFCCYPGSCSARDISTVCPKLELKELNSPELFDLFPNPAEDQLTVKTFSSTGKEIKFSIYNAYGQLILEKNIGMIQTGSIQQIDVSALPGGLYLFCMSADKNYSTIKFIKN